MHFCLFHPAMELEFHSAAATALGTASTASGSAAVAHKWMSVVFVLAEESHQTNVTVPGTGWTAVERVVGLRV